MSKLYTFMILPVLFASCLAKNSNEPADNPLHETGTQEVQTMQETQAAAARQPRRTMFINAPSGLRVRSSPNLQGDAIGVLSDLSEVAVLGDVAHSENIAPSENIEGIIDKWTFIETDAIQGWVSGRFLSTEPVLKFKITLAEPSTGVYPVHIEATEWPLYVVFSDGSRENELLFDPATWYGSLENTKVFSTNSKEAEYELITDGRLFTFFEIEQIEDWLFLDNRGFVYLYDLPCQ